MKCIQFDILYVWVASFSKFWVTDSKISRVFEILSRLFRPAMRVGGELYPPLLLGKPDWWPVTGQYEACVKENIDATPGIISGLLHH